MRVANRKVTVKLVDSGRVMNTRILAETIARKINDGRIQL